MAHGKSGKRAAPRAAADVRSTKRPLPFEKGGRGLDAGNERMLMVVAFSGRGLRGRAKSDFTSLTDPGLAAPGFSGAHAGARPTEPTNAPGADGSKAV